MMCVSIEIFTRSLKNKEEKDLIWKQLNFRVGSQLLSSQDEEVTMVSFITFSIIKEEIQQCFREGKISFSGTQLERSYFHEILQETLNGVMDNVLSFSFSPLTEANTCLSLIMALDDSKEYIIVEYSLPNLLHTRIFRDLVQNTYSWTLFNKYLLQILNSSSLYFHHITLSCPRILTFALQMPLDLTEFSSPLIFPFSLNPFILSLVLFLFLGDYSGYFLTRIFNLSSYYSTIQLRPSSDKTFTFCDLCLTEVHRHMNVRKKDFRID